MNLLEQKDFLMQLCSRLDNQSLELLSKTSLWLIIREFAQEQYFWYLRVQYLVGRELKSRIGDWKRAYYLLELALRENNPFTFKVLLNSLSVSILLELGYDPTSKNNDAIRLAVYTNSPDVVKILLEDGRADPTMDDNRLITHASGEEYTEVLRLLLEDGRADPTIHNNQLIISASIDEHLGVLRLLLEDGRADPTARNNRALEEAYDLEYSEVIRLLEQDPRVKARS